ncbi:hypothetical protein AYI69_g6872 [Smittium culicis]|uniref:Uncharacterized protein n=1 Tax=Smittium culicis TaxID=133412 RepID=A0A1R1XVZ0_9FUNG|nr:hypothetical protein AYI69_g6872 [Smittium culicis]
MRALLFDIAATATQEPKTGPFNRGPFRDVHFGIFQTNGKQDDSQHRREGAPGPIQENRNQFKNWGGEPRLNEEAAPQPLLTGSP